ncbi:hypothetical protein T440DRAFT_477907 [Plenodomus tracheiphilus IPT5]|uniref:Hydrophobin n=1 Tax=Plenodomus tracheiphilus IPT5 TaxID=1408161 RepID=A0A6A7B937_9PLEO|nr:hypothetical protein T440DRAFT_477907 [Plenodomus tracheiphilus IPT5]
MRFQPSHLIALALMPALTLARPSLQVEIKEVGTSQAQKPFHHKSKMCQPENALCGILGFGIECCDGLVCDTESSSCRGEGSVKNTNKGDDMHAMCRTAGEFCQLIPIPLACCGNLECSSIFGGTCES